MKNIAAIVVLLAAWAGAKDKPKEYLHTGKVVSFHAQAEVWGDEDFFGTYQRRVYVIKTETGTIEVTGWEKRGKAHKRPPLDIGQELKYRTDGKFIYTVLDDGKEHRFYLMSARQD